MYDVFIRVAVEQRKTFSFSWKTDKIFQISRDAHRPSYLHSKQSLINYRTLLSPFYNEQYNKTVHSRNNNYHFIVKLSGF